jgi:hypothetical protein
MRDVSLVLMLGNCTAGGSWLQESWLSEGLCSAKCCSYAVNRRMDEWRNLDAFDLVSYEIEISGGDDRWATSTALQYVLAEPAMALLL